MTAATNIHSDAMLNIKLPLCPYNLYHLDPHSEEVSLYNEHFITPHTHTSVSVCAKSRHAHELNPMLPVSHGSKTVGLIREEFRGLLPHGDLVAALAQRGRMLSGDMMGRTLQLSLLRHLLWYRWSLVCDVHLLHLFVKVDVSEPADHVCLQI